MERLLGAGHEAAPFARISSLKHHSSPKELGKAERLAKAARPVCARPALALARQAPQATLSTPGPPAFLVLLAGSLCQAWRVS